MNVSMDGLRTNLSRHVSNVRDLIKQNGDVQTQHAMDRLIMAANALNCVYDDEQEDFSDLSEVQVPFISEDK